MKTRYKFIRLRCHKFPSITIILLLIFSFTNFFFFYYLYESQNAHKISHIQNWPPHFAALLHRNFQLQKNEWRLITKLRSSGELNCSSLRKIRNKEYIGNGWTKVTFKTKIDGVSVAVKSVNLKGFDVSNCIDANQDTPYGCYMKASAKVLTEIVRLHILQHPNIIRILGYCVPETPEIYGDEQLSIVTELGEPIDVIKLLQMSWDDRLKISWQIGRLLYHLSDTPLGSIALNDFRRQQFVFVHGNLKLVDVDDVGTKNPPCDESPCCIGPMHNKTTTCLTCEHHICKGYNEKQNILNAGRHFIKHILPHGVPSPLVALADAITEAYEKALWSSAKILQETERLMEVYVQGQHQNKTKYF